eukprot:gnl/MRDRNA2_/MRDRNA2_91591_c0_seq1.p1 gnl/MRDRNA2_/MRDRNA2_91591_c0~~gnl/MRDRNA2_/MRDRNA2_91591_c0_seq1.p1  ORF type:complete len:375 (-),score=66.13 gnl/MRDRNA2_/MRDRNA2_91591_c0_seq1:314-1438(-)
MPMPMPFSGGFGQIGVQAPPCLEDSQWPTPPSGAHHQWCPPPVGVGPSSQEKDHSFWAQPWKIRIDMAADEMMAGSTRIRPNMSQADLENSHLYHFKPLGLENMDDNLDPYQSQQTIPKPPSSQIEGQSQGDFQEYSQRAFGDSDGNTKAYAGDIWPDVPPGLFPVKGRMRTLSQQQQQSIEESLSSPRPVETCNNKWHLSSLASGELYQDGHVFVKTKVGPKKQHPHGIMLSSLCMIFDQTLVTGGSHTYHFSVMGGSVSAADGIGFVFDSKIQRNNIQRMRSVFLNKHGHVCLRNLGQIMKLKGLLPELAVGSRITLRVDLDHATAQFKMEDESQTCTGMANLSFRDLVKDGAPSTGFFCAVLSDSLTVSLY